jgi:Sec7-like guanine-nucleotide exchange factor
MYNDNEILFPHYAITHLKRTRSKAWGEFVERISKLPENHEEVLAFMLMMIRLNGCMNCETDSFRAMKGCIPCAQQSLKRFKGADEELYDMFNRALQDVRKFASQAPEWKIKPRES